jgi:tetratricopeptide (TPR) repeat protein
VRSWRAIALAGLSALLLAEAAGAGAETTPAERTIAAARKAIDARPEHASGYRDLAFGYARRARETSDPAFYERGEKAITRALELAPGDLEAEKARVWILLGKHEFAQARARAEALLERAPDDVLVHGFLADAHVELGEYEQAERAAQRMLDLRPGNVPGLTRAAHLRELYGDLEGALELMSASYERLPPAEVEDRAWVLVQIGRLLVLAGRTEDAESVLTRSLSLFPRYHYALAELARLRATQGRHGEAVDLLRQRYEAAPHPENLHDLAQALERAGRSKEAERAYRDFEKRARAESDRADNANRELVLYYVDRARKPEAALRIAEREMKRRRDVFTRDAHAWALHANGRTEEARVQIEKALAVGIRDPVLFYHGGVIASKHRDRSAALQYLQRAAVPGAAPEIAAAARMELAALRPR